MSDKKREVIIESSEDEEESESEEVETNRYRLDSEVEDDSDDDSEYVPRDISPAPERDASPVRK